MSKIKITKFLLANYRRQVKDIPVLELELQLMKTTDSGLGNDTILDCRTGYPRPQSVVGFNQKLYDKRQRVVDRKKAEVAAVVAWIDAIEDGQTRNVFRMFYIDGMKWPNVAMRTGFGGNEDYPRLYIRDTYLKKCGIK